MGSVNYLNRNTDRSILDRRRVWFDSYTVKFSEPIQQYICKGYKNHILVNMDNVLYMEPIYGEQCTNLYMMHFTNGYKLCVKYTGNAGN